MGGGGGERGITVLVISVVSLMRWRMPMRTFFFFSKNFIFYCEIVYGVLIRFCLQNPTLALRYNDIDIKMTTCDKILGIQVDENLIWNSQCQQSILIFIAVEQNKIIFIH